MSENVKAWQCIGCGSIEAPQTCIGVCTHRKVEFVYAFEHEKTLRELDSARKALDEARSLLRQVVRTKPHEDAWKESYIALQEQARRLLMAGQRTELLP